jgi:transposase-like protein
MQAHDGELKAQCIALLLQGQVPSAIEKTTGVSKWTIYKWKREGDVSQALKDMQEERRAEIEGLMFEYVTTGLRSLRKQAEVMGEDDWIRKQNAEGLAIVHGVAFDKVVRVLEAANTAAQIEDADGDEGSEEPS